MTFFIIGVIDLLSGLIIVSSPAIPFFETVRYLGFFLIFKGAWSIISDLAYILSSK